MMNKIKDIFFITMELSREEKQKFIILLTVLSVFKIESPLLLPLLIKWIYNAVGIQDTGAIIAACVQGFILFLLNVLFMFFINVYGDAWSTRVSFCAAKNVIVKIGMSQTAEITGLYQEGDIFNRIAKGTGSMVSLCLSTLDLICNAIAVFLVLIMFGFLSYPILLISLIFLVIQFIRTFYLFHKNKQFSEKLLYLRGEGLEWLNSAITDERFHNVNGTGGNIISRYRKSRSDYYSVEQRRTFIHAMLDGSGDILGAVVKGIDAGIVYHDRKGGNLSMGEVNSLFSFHDVMNSKSHELYNAISALPNTIIPIAAMKELLTYESHIRTVCKRDEEKAVEAECVTVKRQGRVILDRLSLCIYKKQKTAIIGNNGSGKTTCLKCMLGSISYEGNITFYNHGINSIGYIPSENRIFRQSTVKENILMGVMQTDLDKGYVLPGELPEKNQKCDNLSGGEIQRISILRSLIQNREIIFADEPASALNDEMGRLYMKELLNTGQTVVYVTHKPEYAALADRIIILKDGKAVELDKKRLEESALYKEWIGNEEKYL